MTGCTGSQAAAALAASSTTLRARTFVGQDLVAGYAAMSADEAREAEAEAWSEELVGDVASEPGRRGR